VNPYNPVAVAHRFIRSLIREGDLCIDATVGNGHDTIFLADLVGEKGKVLGFDVQSSAIESTRAALVKNQLSDRVKLFEQGHETLGAELSEGGKGCLKLVVFNLGYLPGSDKSVVTQSGSTQQALEQGLANLQADGAISVIVYRGHAGGNEEYAAVEAWIDQLSVDSYFCLRYERWTHQRGLTPVFFWIQRRDNDIA
jgi:SAM-dependent methyltransferase